MKTHTCKFKHKLNAVNNRLCYIRKPIIPSVRVSSNLSALHALTTANSKFVAVSYSRSKRKKSKSFRIILFFPHEDSSYELCSTWSCGPAFISFIYKRIRNELKIKFFGKSISRVAIGSRLYSTRWTHLMKSDDLSMICSNSGNDNAPSSSKSASFRTLCINCFISLSDRWFWLPTRRSITSFRSLIPNISSPSKSTGEKFLF